MASVHQRALSAVSRKRRVHPAPGLHEAFASQGTDDTEQAIVNYVWLVMLSGIIMLIFACVYKNKARPIPRDR